MGTRRAGINWVKGVRTMTEREKEEEREREREGQGQYAVQELGTVIQSPGSFRYVKSYLCCYAREIW